MSNESEPFSKRLVAADNEPSRNRTEQELVLRELIEKELRFERKLEKLLWLTWSTTVISVVVLAVCFLVLRTEQGTIVEYARMLLLIAGTFGVTGLAIATMSTFAWLFKSRSASLAVIEKRLASIEQSLRSSEPY